MSEKNCDSFKRLPSGSTTDTESCKMGEREGGAVAWFTVLGSILVYYASFGVMNSFGFFQNFYHTEFLHETPLSQIALIGTMQMALMNSLAVVSGALCDLYGVKVSICSGSPRLSLPLTQLVFVRWFWCRDNIGFDSAFFSSTEPILGRLYDARPVDGLNYSVWSSAGADSRRPTLQGETSSSHGACDDRFRSRWNRIPLDVREITAQCWLLKCLAPSFCEDWVSGGTCWKSIIRG
ncbi:hypothetical protein LEMA_P116670.1 [Plenodomus lingam JN3]|uniref:Major facilitator superfamily (MFS) profile domain-containing protein n=1 Tax=Leptosphaeria maculans (strain JN3 / isolate v23.1.3 / race Av1-4-5-6-7-8) TaxID=985895 RepID=E4ZTV4_LEPMJ|nr:hypothetical protein LEMA_P116670.1 [Plenodomus lingam JN3]CBX94664.1 hypothetical protein LEMA_P116670.1 [Plenodomus lingam JN3]